MSQKSDVQKYEPDFFERTYPSITKDVSIAFSEIVANAWDASSTRINITIPRELNENIIIEDNGSGMTDDEFRNRWMVISYNRVTHQGEYIEPLPDRGKVKRLAYGRNGVGRHAMVCFNNYYTVETFKDGKRNEYDISAVSDGNSVLSIVDHRVSDCTTTGTKLIVKAVKKLPTVSEIRDALSYKFLFDPEFQIYVNNKLVDYHNLLIPTKKDSIKIGENTAEISIYEVPDGEKVTASTGIAFWIGNLPGLTFARLVGNPSWIVGGYTVADARRKFAKKHIIMVKADFLRVDVLSDWSGLQKTELVNSATKAVSAYVKKFRAAYYSDKVSEMKEDVIRQNIDEIETLSISSRHELREFFDIYLSEKPEVDIEELNTIIGALINILNSRNGLSLLNKLSGFDGAEISILDDALSEWSAYDIKTVLDEIDGRIKVIHAIEKLCGDKTVNELQILHPLITQAK
jgi:predicted transcriptional regulator